MIAITTKYIGPTNHRWARVVAVSGNGHRLFWSWDHALSAEGNHSAAAEALASKYQWHGRWIAGGTDNGYCFVLEQGASFIVSEPQECSICRQRHGREVQHACE